MSFVIMTDTSANLPTPDARNNGIVVVPLSYYVDGSECTCMDTEAFESERYYESMKNGVKITTSQINPQKYIDAMEPVLEQGNDILFVGMSSGVSGSYGSAEIAKEQLLSEYPERRIRLVDSLAASLGEGLLVYRAIECRQQGMSLDETAELLMDERHQICQIFTVDDLMHLRRGGRLSNASAIIGTLLNVKPLLKGNENGQIVTFGKVRGRKAVIEQMVQRYEKFVKAAGTQTVCISHANCKEDALRLAELLKRSCPPKGILIVDHEPVTGSYLGPGALALYFMGDDEVRKNS